ncbi:MAG: VOC family protein [Chloroflexota bacterium]
MIELNSLHHCSIVVQDLEASRRFYCDVLGMEEVLRPAKFQFKGQWFRKNRCEVHTIHASEARQASGDPANVPRSDKPEHDVTFARHMCFSIHNVDQALYTLTQHNISLTSPPRERGDGAIQLYVYDPDGHLIELVYEPSP